MDNFHPIFPYLSAVNYVPYTQDIRNIYVRYTQDNRVVNLRIPYLPPAFYLFLSAFFLETTSLPLRYHSITIQYFPRTLLPVKHSAISRRVNKYSSIVSTCSRVFYFFFVHQPRIVFGSCLPTCYLSSARRYPAEQKNTRKYDFSCTSANFVVPLHPNPTLEGNMSCEKRFAKALSMGRF